MSTQSFILILQRNLWITFNLSCTKTGKFSFGLSGRQYNE